MIEQFVIAACGIGSVLLSQDRRPGMRRWACIVGMAAQPFWIYATWKAEQWGIFALAFVYFFGWARGFVNFWIRGRAA